MDARGFYLRTNSIARLEDIFIKYVLENLPISDSDLSDLQDTVLCSGWNDFDELYIALYKYMIFIDRYNEQRRKIPSLLKLRSRENIFDFDHKFESDCVTIKCDFLLDLDFKGNRYSKNRFLDEYEIMSLVKFRDDFEKYINFDTRLVAFDVGCVYLSFATTITTTSDIEKIEPASDKKTSCLKFFEHQLDTLHWRDIRKLYKVAQQQTSVMTIHGEAL